MAQAQSVMTSDGFDRNRQPANDSGEVPPLSPPSTGPTSSTSSLSAATATATASATRRSTLDRTDSEVRHSEYIAKLEVPTIDQISSIAQIQEERERELQHKYAQDEPLPTSEQQADAAEKIQRTFRGHRARRQMQGLTLDPTTRWIEALKAARYQNITDPKRRRALSGALNPSLDDRRGSAGSAESHSQSTHSMKPIDARRNWHHISSIATHAIGELPGVRTPDAEDDGRHSRRGSSQRSSRSREKSSDRHGKETKAKRQEHQARAKSAWKGKTMDLPYFLEMVDQKHRYGSNLRAYHREWMRSDTTQSYFWWLDHGDGKDVEIANVSRKRLEREQVRYLSREERLQYLVHVDDEGKLIWAKNGNRITTSTEYRDSVEGIVPIDSNVKSWREDEMRALEEDGDQEPRTSSDSRSVESGSPPISPISDRSQHDAERRYPDPPPLQEAKGAHKAKHVSAQAIINRLLRKTLVAQNTWIFAVDANMNLYMGIKQSGSFQHSSFMRGSRLSSAGTMKVKTGQIRAINPLSGHYRPPAKAFRHFVHHLRDTGADMSRVSISKSYAVLVGLEMYMGGKKKAKNAEKRVKRGASMIVHPAKMKEIKEQEKDTSQSAQLERELEREEKGPLVRALADAKEKVEVRWAALDAKRTEDKGPADVQQVPDIPEPDVSHQEGLDKPYKEPEDEAGPYKRGQSVRISRGFSRGKDRCLASR